MLLELQAILLTSSKTISIMSKVCAGIQEANTLSRTLVIGKFHFDTFDAIFVTVLQEIFSIITLMLPSVIY